MSDVTEVAKLGHDEIAHAAQAATCTEIGWDAYVTCSRCDYTTYEEKEALGHDLASEWTTDAEQHWHECTCGYQTDTQSHGWDNGQVTKEPTETECGIKTYTCSVCGATKEESIDPVEAPETSLPQDKDTEETTDSGLLVIVVSGAIGAGAIAVVVALVLRKKKKSF